MSGITLTPVVATPVVAVAEAASDGASGFGDALGAAMAQFAENSSAVDDPALQMADRGQALADDPVKPDGVMAVPPGAPDAYAQLMIAMAQLINHGNPKDVPGYGASASESSLSEGVGRKFFSRGQEMVVGGGVDRLPDMAGRISASDRDVLFPFGDDASTSRVNDVGELRSGANFAAVLQDLPAAGSETKLAAHDLTQVPGGSAALNHSGVIEVRQQEGRKELVISTPVSSAGWGDELGSKTLIMVRDGQQSAEMQLNPPNLGPLEVRLSVQNDQTSLIFVSAHASVRDAIQSALPRLSGMLAESGLSMGSVQVGDQSLAQQQQRDGGNAPRRFARSTSAEADGVAVVADAIPLHRANWRLSMFV